MRLLSVCLTACSALALAGCGGGEQRAAPKIDRATAQQLADKSDAIADSVDAGDLCGAAHQADELQADAQAAVDEGRVPAQLADELERNARALVNDLNCPPPPPPPPAEEGCDALELEKQRLEDAIEEEHGKAKKELREQKKAIEDELERCREGKDGAD